MACRLFYALMFEKYHKSDLLKQKVPYLKVVIRIFGLKLNYTSQKMEII